ncbi:MAG: prepilin-type N-terminal cleavage/methylation domain-containing protein [Burkholderiales bacterium]
MNAHYLRSYKHQQQGFTLVEIGIVLLIIGLLLGGVLKGQELVESARVKNAASMFNSVAAAVNGYRDRYRNLPGDDCCVVSKSARSTTWATAMNGTGQNTAASGFIDDATVAAWGAWNGWQHVTFWLDLYASGFLSGNISARDASVFPKHPWGGSFDIVAVGSVYGLPTNTLVGCMNSVPGKAAVQLDTSLDDGNPSTGSVRATVATLPSAAVPGITTYSEDSIYMICKPL